MKPAVIREILCVDANRQLHINIPADMGDEFEVIVLPICTNAANELSEEDQFMVAAYSAVTESSSEEDAVWEKYVRN